MTCLYKFSSCTDNCHGAFTQAQCNQDVTFRQALGQLRAASQLPKRKRTFATVEMDIRGRRSAGGDDGTPFCAVKNAMCRHIHDKEEAGSKKDPATAQKYVALLKVCAKQKDLPRGRIIHAEVSRKGLLHTDIFVASAVVNMYAKCGLVGKAREVFDKLPVRDVVLWNVLIAGYTDQGCGEEALKCYDQMQLQGHIPNAVTFVCSLKACARMRAIDKGQELHSEIIRMRLLERGDVATSLISLYAKCGILAKAQEIFDKLPARGIVSWNALIAGYAEHGQGEEALSCFEQMRVEGLSPNAVTFVCSLKACTSIGAIDKAQEIHTEIDRQGLLGRNVFIATALVSVYARFGLKTKAQEVFDKLPVRPVTVWNALIAGYAENGYGEEALDCFHKMQLEGLSPDAVTFVCSLKACASLGAADKGQEIHADIIRKGFLTNNVLVANALITMYAKCGLMPKAQEVFDNLPVRDATTWTMLIAGYAEDGAGHEALNFLEKMQVEGLSPDAVTFACSLKACGSIGVIDKGQEIHSEIVKKGLLERDMVIGNVLVDVYSKCGWLAEAQEVFDKLPVQDIVSWNSLITGYIEHGHADEALDCFTKMQMQSISPDPVTFTCSLKACAMIGALDKGQEIHSEIARTGLLERDAVVATALVDMYAKCGLLTEAEDVFDEIPVQDVISWGVLISGYAQLGEAGKVIHMFNQMIGHGIKPDQVTFLSVLVACSHLGLVDKGKEYFEHMSKDHGITPTHEHLTCMVDLLARAGQLEKAIDIIEKMPLQADPSVWKILLGACQKWGNSMLGKVVFERAVQLDEKDPAAYICMSNIYSEVQEDGSIVGIVGVERQ